MIFMGPDHVEVQGIPYPKLELDSMSSPVESERQKRKCNHGAILKVVTTNICGSDQHMVRGRTSLPGGHMVLGHEITGEIVELGDDCEFLNVGDVCSVPFNIACGRCAACKRGDTGVCLNVNPARAGAAYGYVDMGGWVGGQAEYVMVPYADFNLLKFPDKESLPKGDRHAAPVHTTPPTVVATTLFSVAVCDLPCRMCTAGPSA